MENSDMNDTIEMDQSTKTKSHQPLQNETMNDDDPSLPPNSSSSIQEQRQERQEQPSNNGIDIQEALSILSVRAQQGGNSEAFQNGGSSVNPQLKSMGQTIDFMSSPPSSSSSQQQQQQHGQNGNGNINETMESRLMTQERIETSKQSNLNHNNNNPNSKTQEQLRQKLQNQSPSELLQAIFQLQQERVKTYQTFDESLDKVLSTNNLTYYPTVATSITATFVVISNSIKVIQGLFLTKHDRKDISEFIQRLQLHEKDKLHLTAALHLEKMRERNDEIDVQIGSASASESSSGSSGSGNERIASLLRESIISLQGKITEKIESINEIMEELRYVLAEME